MTDASDQVLAVADRLFASIEAGDVDAVREVYDPSVRVWHNGDGLEQDVEQNLAVLGWCMRNIQRMRYEQVRRHRTPTGFVQQHVLRGTAPDGSELEVPACLVVEVHHDRVTRIDEYMDRAHIEALVPR